MYKTKVFVGLFYLKNWKINMIYYEISETSILTNMYMYHRRFLGLSVKKPSVSAYSGLPAGSSGRKLQIVIL